MSDAGQYRARAEQEFANAAAATLENVRERSERAAKAWSAMADRAGSVEAARSSRESKRST